MTSKGTHYTDQVIDALEAIASEDGFFTSAGMNVRRGRPERLRIDIEQLPMIAVNTTSAGSRTIKPRTNRKDRQIEVVGIVAAGESDYEPALDDLDEDITRALSALTDMDALPGAMDVDIEGGEYTNPEGGGKTANGI